MTPTVLLQELKKLLEGATANLSFGEGDSRRAPQVFIGYPPRPKAGGVTPSSPVPGVVGPTGNVQVLPNQPQPPAPNPFNQERIYPLIVVRVLDCVDVEDNLGQRAEATVRIICGVRSVDESGYLDILHLTQVVRQTLLEALNIGGFATLQRPFQMTVYEDQVAPYWVSDGDGVFEIPTILRRFDV
ncbi:hypothetical protein [Paenibacillus hubeiensis]|uniref:hypothetical protein n=1 Tax=Paenibacillus hubeiensis TaxID=3077330 RepID=UPI0031BB8435